MQINFNELAHFLSVRAASITLCQSLLVGCSASFWFWFASLVGQLLVCLLSFSLHLFHFLSKATQPQSQHCLFHFLFYYLRFSFHLIPPFLLKNALPLLHPTFGSHHSSPHPHPSSDFFSSFFLFTTISLQCMCESNLPRL